MQVLSGFQASVEVPLRPDVHAGDALEGGRVQPVGTEYAATAAFENVCYDSRRLALPVGGDDVGLVPVGKQPHLIVVGGRQAAG